MALVSRLRAKSSPLQLYSTVGVHPHDAKDVTQETWPLLRELIEGNPSIVKAVGECGLDYNRMFSPANVQQRVFRRHLELSNELDMPLFLHQRESIEDFKEITGELLKGREDQAVVHYFTESRSELEYLIHQGFYIGLTGYICNNRGKETKALIPSIRRDRLLIETDAPFMTPRGVIGKKAPRRCEPAMLTAVAQTVAEMWDISVDEVAEITTANTKRLFRIHASE